MQPKLDFEAVEQLLTGIEPDLSRGAAWGRAALPYIERFLESKNATLVARAALLAGLLHDVDAGPVLRRAGAHPDPIVRTAVTYAVSRSTSGGVAIIADLLDDADFTVRYRAAQAAGRLGYPKFAERLRAMAASDPLAHVREAAEKALADMEQQSSR